MQGPVLEGAGEYIPGHEMTGGGVKVSLQAPAYLRHQLTDLAQSSLA